MQLRLFDVTEDVLPIIFFLLCLIHPVLRFFSFLQNVNFSLSACYPPYPPGLKFVL